MKINTDTELDLRYKKTKKFSNSIDFLEYYII